MSEKIRRNDPCPCGSQRKFKQCCAGKGSRTHRGKYVLFFLLLSGAVMGGILPIYKSWKAKSRTSQASGVSGTETSRPLPAAQVVLEDFGSKRLSSQPPGPVPEGKVWSPEHGHWHNAPGANPASEGSSTNIRSSAQPPGPVPEGKVWSPEHGHWHNAPSADPASEEGSSTNSQLSAQPPVPVPEGKVGTD